MDPSLDARTFSELAGKLLAWPTPVRTSEGVVSYALEQLDAEYAGITLLRSRGRLETVAPSDPLVDQIDELQYGLGEGPCHDSSWHNETMVSQDLSVEARWPEWAPKAYALGVGSALAVELNDDARGNRLGSLNMYWTQPRLFTADEVTYTNIFARHAAVALSTSMREAGLQVAMMAASGSGRRRAC